MTPIEELVREALAQTSTAQPPKAAATTDPLAALDRRVRRARRRIAAGAGALAAVLVAAVVVPLAVLGGNGAPNRVGVVQPRPTPTAPPPAGTTTLWDTGAIWASTAPDGQRWLLFSTGTDYYVGEVRSDGSSHGFKIEGPADYVVAGDHVVWVIGGGDGGSTMSRLTALDPRTGDVQTRAFEQSLLSFAVTSKDDLYVDRTDSTGGHVDLFSLSGGQIQADWSRTVANPQEIGLTAKGHVWVQSGRKLIELPSGPGSVPGTTVDWSGDVFGPASPDDSLWAYDGDRLIGLTPKNLLAGVSVAEGYRLSVTGKPIAVVPAAGGGLFVATDRDRIDYYSPQDVQGSGTSHTADLLGVRVITMTADPAGGVDYVDDQGRLIHWDPSAVPAR